MPELVGVRFSRVGFSETRIDGLGYDLTRDGEAKNSLVITGNGGGKTTQIHLLFSLFNPQKYDLMTHRDNTGRRFEYYFEENEIAFIASEWTIPNTQVTLGGRPRTRVIGCFTQFTSRDRYEHETHFFSFIADDALGIDDLPITSSIPHRVKGYCRTVGEAKKYLKETFDRPGREFYGPSRKMEEWQEYLVSVGFNIEIFRLMQMFTMSEGDPAAFLKRYCKNEAILGLITRDVMDKASTSRLRDMLLQHRESIRLAPTTRAQIAAYNAVFELFSRMEPVAQRLAAAQDEHRKAQEELGSVAGRVEATLTEVNGKVARLGQAQDEEGVLLAGERKKLGEMEGEWRGVAERLAAIAHLEAKEKLLQAGMLHKEKETLVDTLRALVDRAEVLALQSVRDDLARRLDALAEPTRNLADEVAMAETLLAGYLEEDLRAAGAALGRLERELEEASARKGECSREKDGVQSKLGGVRREEELLKESEAERERSLAALACHLSCAGKGGRAPAEPVPLAPGDALIVLEETRLRLKEQSEAVRRELAEVAGEKAAAAARLESVREALERRRREEAAVTLRYQEYLKKHDSVCELPGIADLFRLEAVDLFLPGLDSRLKTNVVECERDIRTVEEEIATRQERIRAIEKNGGLLPPSRDVETVLETLRAEKLDAHSYWHVFSQQNRSSEESAQALGNDPLRVGGVAVSGAAAVAKAKELLKGCQVLSPVAVSDYTSDIRPRDNDGFVVLPDAALAIDRKRAREFCLTAESEIADRQRRMLRLEAARSAAQEARDALLGFLGTYNGASEELIKDERTRTRNEIAAGEAEAGRLAERVALLDDRAEEKEESLAELGRELSAIEPGIEALGTHVAKYESGREHRLNKLLQLSLEIVELERTQERLDEELRVAASREKAAQAAVFNGAGRARAIEEELAGLSGNRIPCTESFRLLAANADSARTLHAERTRALEAANANQEYMNAKAQFDAAQDEYQKKQKRWNNLYGAIPARQLELALSSAVAGAAATEEDCLRAAEARDEAFKDKLRAEQVLELRHKEEADLKKSHVSLAVSRCELELPEARERKDALTAAMAELASTVARREREMEERARELELARSQAALFRILAADLAVSGGDRAFALFASADEAQAAVGGTRKLEKDARQRAETLLGELQRLNLDLAALLDGDSCQSIAAMGSLIKEEQRRCEGVLKEDVDAFLTRISNAVESLKFELGQHEENERKVIEQVTLDVKKAHGYLKKLENRSKVPTLGGIWTDWSGRSFIRFRSKVEIDGELSRQVIADTVATISQVAGDLPPGDQIVLTALCNVLDKKYVIETLKPDSSPTTVYRSIEHPTGLNSWSGGERLSGAVLFYLAICNLLAVEGQTDNVMLLDNPFGSCTNIDFIRLVLALARQYGVQVVAFTPTEVEDIRRLFPLNIMIRKGGADGIVKRTGRPLVKYERTIYNEGEIALLELTREAPSHVPA